VCSGSVAWVSSYKLTTTGLVSRIPMHLIQPSINPVIPHRFMTDRVKTRHDITTTQTLPTLFALSSSLVWDCKTSCTLAASGGTRDKHTTYLLLDRPYRVISSQCPQTCIFYLAVPSLLIKLTSLLDLTCLNLCTLQVIKNWRWEGLRTRLSGDCLRECSTTVSAGKQFHSISHLSEACHG